VVIGESYNDYTGKGPEAEQISISSNWANTPTNTEMYEDYMFPETTDNLSEHPRKPSPGILEAIEEKPTTHEFYDGSLNLSKVKVHCIIHTSIADCVGENGCGWCSSDKGCIFGTKIGPLQPCVKSSYIGALRNPQQNYNKFINEPVGLVRRDTLNKDSNH
jgi:hypothetical protein